MTCGIERNVIVDSPVEIYTSKSSKKKPWRLGRKSSLFVSFDEIPFHLSFFLVCLFKSRPGFFEQYVSVSVYHLVSVILRGSIRKELNYARTRTKLPAKLVRNEDMRIATFGKSLKRKTSKGRKN